MKGVRERERGEGMGCEGMEAREGIKGKKKRKSGKM